MPRIALNEVVPFTCQQMYDLVIDVERYAEFLPWCVKCLKFDEEHMQFVADMTVSFKGVREKFQTVDSFDPGKRVMVTLKSGPFEHLNNEWNFHEAPGGCRVDFVIDFKFRSRLMEMTMGPLFSHVSRQMVAAFRKRAEEIYGSGIAPAS